MARASGILTSVPDFTTRTTHPWLRLCKAVLTRLTAVRVPHERSYAARRKALGDAGEMRAYLFLRRSGYIVVARQWRAPHVDGEVDLIAWQGETLCFVEVKTRSGRDRFAAERTIGSTKQQALRRMARAYVRGLFSEGDAPPAIRFDVITVLRVGSGRNRTWRIDLRPGQAFTAGPEPW